MSAPAFFGYGSLVNLATHNYVHHPFKARLPGWRRVWRHSSQRPVAFLSVERAADSEIQGLVAHLPDGDWTALDAREHGYDRHDISGEIRHDQTARPMAIYQAAKNHIAPPSTRHPILLSYLDVVVQGFLNEFGADGVRAFFATTTGFDTPILDDRGDPVYPRHQVHSLSERRVVDTSLEDLSVSITRKRPPGL